MTKDESRFYQEWAALLEWMREYAAGRDGVDFVKQADFTGYIYRMARPKDLPTTIMSASLSVNGKPVLLLSCSPQDSVFKEVQVHPFGTHIYRKLSLDDSGRLAEASGPFTRESLHALADRLLDAQPVAA